MSSNIEKDSNAIDKDIKKLVSVDTNIGDNTIEDTDILYIDKNNFDIEWKVFVDVVQESSFDIDASDIEQVAEFVYWLIDNRLYFHIEFTSSTNPYHTSHFELIHNGQPTNTTVGDLLLNVASHQLAPIIEPIWDLVEIENSDTLEIYDEDPSLDVGHLTVFKMLAGFYNRSNRSGRKIIFHSYKKLLPKVEKQINIKISGLDELLDTLNDNKKNEYFSNTCRLLDNMRYQTHNFYFNDYSNFLVKANREDIERKYNNNGENNESIATFYRDIYTNNNIDNNTTTVIEMIFYDYFSGNIASFLGMSNSEAIMSTNNEIGEMMNEIQTFVSNL